MGRAEQLRENNILAGSFCAEHRQPVRAYLNGGRGEFRWGHQEGGAELDKEEPLFTERGITNVNGTDSLTGKFNTRPEPGGP